MDISFQKKTGRPDSDIAFVWKMTIETERPQSLTDHFIPELFYDYFYVTQGEVAARVHPDSPQTLARQYLKTLYTKPLTFTFSTPLTLYGARFALSFGERFWGETIEKNNFLAVEWLAEPPPNLAAFETAVTDHFQKEKRPKNPYPLLTSDLEEGPWLAAYSPRHKRRLYRAAYGISRKELDSIRSVHAFLEQNCDFSYDNPRLIEYVNPEVFYDQPHLNHAFKKMTGLSPLAYFEANSILQDNLMAVSYNAD